MKSTHSGNSFKEIPVEELKNFINPINMSLYIDRKDLHSCFGNTMEILSFINNKLFLR